jgi:2-keto-4-pentenoate hydratase/2-oxohepta-3-ene-1,7-dioic acid hydratase in catechol pathway
MKIIRHLTPNGPAHAALQPDGSAREITGNLFGDFRVTERVVKPGRLLAPLEPANIICIGLNYKLHAAESGKDAPKWPVVFMKNSSALQNPNDPIELPVKNKSTQVDYEAELVVVIGKRCKNVSKADALKYVFGYTCGNDVSARDWQREFGGGQWCQGKGFDTFAPIGPHIVTADEIPDPQNLRVRCILNGETMQDQNTSHMIFSVATLIEFLSASKTLVPGTIIMSGTPHGVGFARNPPVWLKPGDSVTVDIEKVGALTNPVIDEKV